MDISNIRGSGMEGMRPIDSRSPMDATRPIAMPSERPKIETEAKNIAPRDIGGFKGVTPHNAAMLIASGNSLFEKWR